MSADGAESHLQTKHDELHERLTLLAGNHELSEDQRALANAWRARIELFRERALASLSVAFLAAVGRGKSSLIAAATGLRLDLANQDSPRRWSVLPVAAGRTTLGEIRVTFEDRSDILVVVEPLAPPALETEIRIFAQDRFNASRKNKGRSGEDRQPGEELAELLENWLAPGSEDPRGQLHQEALEAENTETLESQWLKRIDAHVRSSPFEQAFTSDSTGLESLEKTLASLMKGTLPAAPVPVCTHIRIPRTELGKEIETIIDTQGIDGGPNAWVKGRADIVQLMRDPHTLLVICSQFEDAPDPVSQSLLETMADVFDARELRERPLRLILVDRRDKDGEPEEEREKRRRLGQCLDKLRRAGIELAEHALLALDVRQDAGELSSVLLAMAAEARKHRREAWQAGLQAAEEATSVFEDHTFASQARELELRLWWQWDAELVGHLQKFVNPFTALGQRLPAHDFHWSQMHATVRRRGHYHQLDLASLGARFAADAAVQPYESALKRVKAEAEKLGAHDSTMAQHLALRIDGVALAIRAHRDAIFSHWNRLLIEYFAAPQSNDLWQWCLDRLGNGKGYVRAVVGRIEEEAARAKLGIKISEPVEKSLPKRPELFSLRKVQLKNFRGINEREHQISNTTVFIGDNGLGKTCWLEAIAAAVGSFLPGVGAGPAPVLLDSDVREVMQRMGGLPDRQRQLPMHIEVDALVDGHALTWKRHIDQLPVAESIHIDDALQVKARQAGEEIRAHSIRQLPVLAYYGTQRLWPADIEPKSDVGSNRLDGYRDCLKAASTHQHMLSWMRKYTFVELQNKKPVAQLQAIQRAVLACIQGAKKFEYKVDLEELVLEMEDGQCPTFRMLSDGYRNMVAMVADIAWRASVLNPHLLDRAPEYAEGVVLIDEIDLHLHPKWQRRVLGDLRRTFPRLQFITTTHSPFIVQSLEPGQLVNLDDRAPDAPYANESPEDIVETHMGVDVPQRSHRREKEYEVAKRYFELLERVPAADPLELAKLKAELDELLAPYADNQALVAFLERQRLMAEAQRA